MPDDSTPNWARANQVYLVAQIAALKQMLRTGDPDHAPAPCESSKVDEAAFAQRAPAIEFLSQAFGLSQFERALLLLCAAPELDQECADIYATAQADPSRSRPTFGLALAVLPGAHWSALAPDGALRRWRLIELSTGAMLTAAALQIDERVLHFLLGVDRLDERLAHLVRVLPLTQRRQLAPSHAQIASDIAALWSSQTVLSDMPLVQLCGQADDCLPILAAAAHECATRGALLSAELAPSGALEMNAFLRLWEREALLSNLGVLVLEREEPPAASADDRRAPAPGLNHLLERATGRVALTGRQRATVTARATMTIEVGHPTAAEQRLVWGSALRVPVQAPASAAVRDSAGATARGRVDGELDRLVAQFDLSMRVIRAVAADAISVAIDSAPAAAWDLCRMFLRDRMEGLAQRIETRARWPDLVLPHSELEVLHAIVAQVRQRRTVYDHWGFARKCGRGLGTSVLFHGPSGAGKTLAAEVLANEMRLDLYRIDLSAVVSKYIGESEKALRRVFDAAEDSGAILLFDEADALFGLRSPVKDSHDRYANIQVSYLLQRIRRFPAAWRF